MSQSPSPHELPGPQYGGQSWQQAPHQLPPPGDADATQYLPPATDFPPAGQPPYGAPVDRPEQELDATQYIPPQGGGELDATQYIPPYAETPDDPYAPPAATVGGAVPHQEAPYPGQGGQEALHQPPAEFDNLFRPEGGRRDAPHAPEEAKSTTQPLPLFEHSVATQSRGRSGSTPHGRQEPLGPPEPSRSSRRAGSHGGGSNGGGNRRPLLLGAGGLAALIVAGLLGGAALGGDGDEGKGDQGAPTAPAQESPKAEPSPEPSEEKDDPVEAQAKELDKLLADSNNSRDAVISSVEKIKKCTALPQAEKDLKAAADQRNSLVTRLDQLTVDQLPQHQQLTTQLRQAWKASAAADAHFANWAKEQRKPRNCKDGTPRSTPHLVSANRHSAKATKAKQQAAKLWNPTARKYDLPERQPTQL